MESRLLKRWIVALRSGKYEQGNGELESVDEEKNMYYCCLGVLRHIVNPKDRRQTGELLNRKQLKAYGLSDEMQYTLSAMNDDGISFKRIAQWLKKRKPADLAKEE